MTEIVLAGPICAPLRNQILTMLHQYGITSARVTDGYALGADGSRGREGAFVLGRTQAVRQIYHVRVSRQAAAWAEYILLRSRQYELLSQPMEERNATWAARWQGRMPKPWRQGQCAAQLPPSSAAAVNMADDSVGSRILRELRRHR